jgi:hypothetical protein
VGRRTELFAIEPCSWRRNVRGALDDFIIGLRLESLVIVNFHSGISEAPVGGM